MTDVGFGALQRFHSPLGACFTSRDDPPGHRRALAPALLLIACALVFAAPSAVADSGSVGEIETTFVYDSAAAPTTPTTTPRTAEPVADATATSEPQSSMSRRPPRLAAKGVDKGRRLASGKVAAFDNAGVECTEHFATRIAQREARSISGQTALDAYNRGTRFYDPATRAHIRYDRQTGVAVVLRKGRAHTVLEQPRPSSRWNPVRYGGD